MPIVNTHARVWVTKNEQLAGNERHVYQLFVSSRFSLEVVFAKALNTITDLQKLVLYVLVFSLH